ncbi:(R)-mandelonitrile lyase [Corallococcus exiguus]|uniref:(R)-mandelonitrile lyase n=1 Tax=Corallococcus exiguus TaxID=83462 RepID=UPI003211B9A5
MALPLGAPVAATPAQGGPEIAISRGGSRPVELAEAEHFTGTVHRQALFGAKPPGRATGGSVTFEPGARSAWHVHPLGQTLIVTAGTGWVQRWDGPAQEFREGDVVRIPAGVKHWHGATANTRMSHIAVQEELDGKNVTWLEKVSDEQYANGPSAAQGAMNMKKEPSALKKQMGDFAPKMVQLTDDVLFGDVWERTELAPRDRSLVTVAALTMGGNTEQLPFHLKKARENGVSEPELVEALTHLAFYCGWPKALSAMNVAKETFKTPAPAKDPSQK